MLWMVPTGFVAFRFAEYVASSANKEVRDTLVLLEQSESAALSSAQYLEAPESTARLHRLIVTPGEYRERQSLGRFLPRAFAGENAIAHRHAELGRTRLHFWLRCQLRYEPGAVSLP